MRDPEEDWASEELSLAEEMEEQEREDEGMFDGDEETYYDDDYVEDVYDPWHDLDLGMPGD